MRRVRHLLHSSLLVVPLCIGALTFGGCGPGTTGDDGGTGDGDGDGDGDTDGGTGDGDGDGDGDAPAGDSCANPIDLTLGQSTNGDNSSGFTDTIDEQSPANAPCTESNDDAVDVIYAVTLDNAASLDVTVTGTGDFDPVVYLQSGNCTAGTQGVCSDEQEGPEEVLKNDLLPAGDYFVVVEGYTDPNVDGLGSFSLVAESVAGGYCLDDVFRQPPGDPIGTGEDTPIALSVGEIEFFDDWTSAGLVPFYTCPGEDDWWLMGHFGGDVTVDITSVTLPTYYPAVGATLDIIQAEGFLNEDELLEYRASDNVVHSGATTFTGDLPIGVYYLVIKHADQAVATHGEYDITVSHTCYGDGWDYPETDVIDDRNAPLSRDIAGSEPNPFDGVLCPGDIDGFNVWPVVDTDVVATYTIAETQGANLDFTVYDAIDEDVLVELAETADYTITSEVVEGNDVVTLTIPGALAGSRYFLQTQAVDGITAELNYSVQVTLPGVDANPPANDACLDAIALTVGDDPDAPTVIAGRTAGGDDSIRGACNQEEGNTDFITGWDPPALGQGAPDVFYTVEVPDSGDGTNNLEVVYDGEQPFHRAAVYLVSGGCPTDAEDPTYVVDSLDVPTCRLDDQFIIRWRAIPAGTYHLVVDSIWFPPGDDPASYTAGPFSINATVYPNGFPPLAACMNATEITLPAVDEEVSFAVDTTDGENDQPEACGTQSLGTESVFVLNPTEDMTVEFRTAEFTGGQDDSYDTMLVLRVDDCNGGTQVACNDDVVQGQERHSMMEADLVGGLPYYLIVDGWGESDVGDTTLFVKRID